MASSSSTMDCGICSAQPSKYSCPRCNIPYCSVDCYKAPAHAQCSETFYRDSVVQEMAMLAKKLPAGLVDSGSSDQNAAEVRKMYEILKRMQPGCEEEEEDDGEGAVGGDGEEYDEEEELDSDDEEEETDDLSTRLHGIDLDDADAVWQRLSAAERAEFERLLNGSSGDDRLDKLIEVRDPWWVEASIAAAKQPPKIVELDGKEPATKPTTASDSASSAAIPAILHSRIVPFAQLSSQPPASCVLFNLMNVLAAYVRTVRFFDGDHLANGAEAASYLLQACGNLRANQNFDDAQIAVESFDADAGEEERDLVAHDVGMLMASARRAGDKAEWTLAALSDVHRLLAEAKKAIGSEEKTQKDGELNGSNDGEFSKLFRDPAAVDPELVSRSKLKVHSKKIEYYMAYVKTFGLKG